MSTGGFPSKKLIAQEIPMKILCLENSDAIQIGVIATKSDSQRNLPITIQIRIGDWVVYHACLNGSKLENDLWIKRKTAVVNLKYHSTIYERVLAEERGVDWCVENNLTDEYYAIHGGALPLTTEEACKGILVISGLPQVEDHLFAVEVLTEFVSRKDKEL